VKKCVFFRAFNLFFMFLASFCVDSAGAQNIVEAGSTSAFAANPVKLTDMEVSEFFLIAKCVGALRPTAGRPWRQQ
jgi:hypothetical protein